MNSKNTFAVAMIGIPEHERHVLTSIFKLSSYRPQSYVMANGTSGTPAQILLVDADDPQAMAQWHAFRGDDSSTIKSTIPTVMVTREKLSDPSPHYLRRPFVATRVLGILDQLVIGELSRVPERVIGEKTKSAPVPVREQEAEPNSQRTFIRTQERPTQTALVVDDSLSVRRQVELELKLFGIEVEAVATGEEAFEVLERKSFDLIFLDVVLPGVDGYQICKAIKKDKLKKRTPVIMLTGKSSPFDRVKGALSGCDTYLTKPVKQASFHKAVKKYLQ
jgi:two-component system cell cycle response regulator